MTIVISLPFCSSHIGVKIISNREPHIYQVVRQTWLSAPISGNSVLISLLATLFVSLLSFLYLHTDYKFVTHLSANHFQVFEAGQVWKAWTTTLIHSDFKHLLSNSLFLFVLGTFLINYFGSFVFPLMGFVFGGLINLIVLAQMPVDIRLIGASGIVFWMGGAWLTLYFLIDLTKTKYQRLIRSIGVGLALFMPNEAFDPQVSYKAHFVGFICGIIFGATYYLIKKDFFLSQLRVETVIEQEDVVFDQ